MKQTVGSFDAKTHLAAYLERVEGGESFIITRRGKPAAELRPVPTAAAERQGILRECARVRAGIAAGSMMVDVAGLVREDRDR